jgi:hypothetical protein
MQPTRWAPDPDRPAGGQSPGRRRLGNWNSRRPSQPPSTVDDCRSASSTQFAAVSDRRHAGNSDRGPGEEPIRQAEDRRGPAPGSVWAPGPGRRGLTITRPGPAGIGPVTARLRPGIQVSVRLPAGHGAH